MMPPGSRALAFASRWFDQAIVRSTFEPLIADWQHEWIDAPPSQRTWVRVKGLLSFWIALAASSPAIFRTRAPKGLTDRIASRIAIGTAIGTGLLTLPFVLSWPMRFGTTAVLLVIPQGLTLVFPFATLAGADAIRRFDGIKGHVARATVIKLALVACVFVFVCNGWVVPAANQVYRETTSLGGRSPARGVREFSNHELVARLTRSTQIVEGTDQYQAAMTTEFRREVNNRATLAILPALLLWRRWRALDVPGGRWLSPRHPAIAASVTIVIFVALRGVLARNIEQAWQLPVGTGAWLALALLAASGVLRMKLTGIRPARL